MRIASLTFCFVVLALGLTAVSASASTADAIIKDCSNSPTGLLTGSYSKSDLRDARKLVRGDIAEYTGCMDAINAALSARSASNGGDGGSNGSNTGGNTGAGGTGGSGTGGSGSSGDNGLGGSSGDGSYGSTAGTTGTPGDTTSGGTPDGTPTTPQTPAAPAPAPTQQAGSGAPVAVGNQTITPGIPASFSDDSRALPTPLIAFLVLLAAGAIGFGAPTIGRRVLARRRA
jgi:hypothetical protein